MIAVISEMKLNEGCGQEYLDIAAELRPMLDKIDGFISVESFQSSAEQGKILSLSFWRDEEAVSQLRQIEAHREAEKKGRTVIFESYRVRITEVKRDYGMFERDQAPSDSPEFHSKLADKF